MHCALLGTRCNAFAADAPNRKAQADPPGESHRSEHCGDRSDRLWPWLVPCSAALGLVGFVSQHSVQLLRIMSPPDRPTPSIHTLATRTHLTESVRAHAGIVPAA